MRITTPPNPLLRWERTRSINLSVDLGLFDRVNTTFTYYHNKGYDLLGEAQLDPTVGYSETAHKLSRYEQHGYGNPIGCRPYPYSRFHMESGLGIRI